MDVNNSSRVESSFNDMSDDLGREIRNLLFHLDDFDFVNTQQLHNSRLSGEHQDANDHQEGSNRPKKPGNVVLRNNSQFRRPDHHYDDSDNSYTNNNYLHDSSPKRSLKHSTGYNNNDNNHNNHNQTLPRDFTNNDGVFHTQNRQKKKVANNQSSNKVPEKASVPSFPPLKDSDQCVAQVEVQAPTQVYSSSSFLAQIQQNEDKSKRRTEKIGASVARNTRQFALDQSEDNELNDSSRSPRKLSTTCESRYTQTSVRDSDNNISQKKKKMVAKEPLPTQAIPQPMDQAAVKNQGASIFITKAPREQEKETSQHKSQHKSSKDFAAFRVGDAHHMSRAEEEKEFQKFTHLLLKAEKALRQARAERTSAQTWANQIRDNLSSLIDEQRTLIKMENSDSNPKDRMGSRNYAAMASVPMSRSNSSSSNNNNNNMEKQQSYEEAAEVIAQLEQVIKGLQLDLKTAELHRQTVELKLHDIIQYQQEKLQKFERQEENSSEGKNLPAGTSQKPRNSNSMQHYSEPQSVNKARIEKTENVSNSNPIPGTTSGVACTPNHGTKKPSDQEMKQKLPLNFELHERAADCIRLRPQQPLHSAESIPAPTTSVGTNQFQDNPMIFDALENVFQSPIVHSSRRKESVQPQGVQTPISSNSTDASSSSSSRSSRVYCRKENGDQIVIFANGTRKEIRRDGSTITKFKNGDCRTTSNGSGAVAYFHAEAGVIQVTASDGSNIFEFPNKQIERHFPDGRKIIKFPDGTKQRISLNGSVETVLAGGKFVLVERPDGTRDVTPIVQTL